MKIALETRDGDGIKGSPGVSEAGAGKTTSGDPHAFLVKQTGYIKSSPPIIDCLQKLCRLHKP